MAYKDFFMDLPIMPVQSGTLNSTTNLSTWTYASRNYSKTIYLGPSATTRNWLDVTVASYKITVIDTDTGTTIAVLRTACTPYTSSLGRKGVQVSFMALISATNVTVTVTANYTYRSTKIVEPNVYNRISLGGQEFKIKSDTFIGYPYKFMLNSGEVITLNWFKNQYEQGIDYTLSSGNNGMGYYYRNGYMIQGTCANWFGNTIGTPISGDIIRIYEFPDGEDYNDWSYIESNISSFKLCHLRFNGSEWSILNDYS